MKIVLVSKCSLDIEQYVKFKMSVLISPSKSLISSCWVTIIPSNRGISMLYLHNCTVLFKQSYCIQLYNFSSHMWPSCINNGYTIHYGRDADNIGLGKILSSTMDIFKFAYLKSGDEELQALDYFTKSNAPPPPPTWESKKKKKCPRFPQFSLGIFQYN